MATVRLAHEIDVRHVLPAIRVPTLILHRTDDQAVSIVHSRYMAERVPGAKLVELPGVDHIPWPATRTLSSTKSKSF
jgi:pimeloyl-ACP methyl ester carboxylesterase